MTPDPYAHLHPTEQVADNVQGEVAPALWNPNAAASWSLVFSPAFGAFLHMKNWQALGESAKAAAARIWVVVTLVVLLGVFVSSALWPNSIELGVMSRAIFFALLFTWYYSSGRPQVGYIKSRFGETYPRRGWAKPLWLALAALVAIFAVGVVIAVVAASFKHEI